MATINVYDFDKTILPYDSTEAFSLFCMRKYPRAAVAALSALPYLAGMPLKITTKTRTKEAFYSFLTLIPDVDAAVKEFWDSALPDINRWYLERHRDDDLVISASPEFLLRPVADALHFDLIASRVDKLSGYTLGENCHGTEKLLRFRRERPNTGVAEFYSDSLSDAPLARLAKSAYLVSGEVLTPWPEKSLRGG